MDRQQLLEIAEAAEAVGDFDTAIEAMTLYNQTPENNRSAAESMGGALESAMSIGSGILAEPIAGLSAIPYQAAESMGFAPSGSAADVVESQREAFTYQPRGDAGKAYMQNVGDALQPVAEVIGGVENSLGDAVLNATGSPELAAIAHTLPTAVLELIGIKGGKLASKVPANRATMQLAKETELAGDIDKIRAASDFGENPTQAGMQNAASVISKASDEDLAALIKADPELYDAYDRLGIVGDLPSELVSSNNQFLEVIGGLRSVPGSSLKGPYSDVIDMVSSRADSIIDELGGTADKASLSARFKESMLDNINEIYDAESKIYDGIDINRSDRFIPENTLNFLNSEISAVGDFSKLPPALKRIYGQLKPKNKVIGEEVDLSLGLVPKNEKIGPTYGNFTHERQKVGGQIGKQFDQIEEFKSVDSSKLKNLYAAMKEDQAAFSTSKGYQGAIDEADKLTIKRKTIEEDLKKTLGSNLEGSLSDIIEGRVKGLSSGKVSLEKFSNSLNRIPKPYRQEAVVSALSGLFKGSGAGQAGYSANQVVKNLTRLNRQPEAKAALMRELPKGSGELLDALLKVSEQINKTSSNTIKTGALKLFDTDSGLIQKMAGKAGGALAVKATGSLAAGRVVDDLFRRETGRASAAAELISSPQFSAMIREQVREGVTDGVEISKKLSEIERSVEKTAKYKAWSERLSQSEKLKLMNLGIISFIVSDSNKKNELLKTGN